MTVFPESDCFRDLDFGHPVLLVKKSLEIGQNSSPSSKTTEIRVNSSNLCRETETWSIGQIPVTGSRNDFRSSFPNNKLRPGRLFTVKVFPEMIPVNSFSGTNNTQPKTRNLVQKSHAIDCDRMRLTVNRT